jgi:organic hydroperoxide reductase OsmC/OhrA
MKAHHYELTLRWTGAACGATTSYAAYAREHTIDIAGKASLAVSADPLFRGDASLHNPEDMLLAALASCHMLSYLAQAARAGVHVHAYEDHATGTLVFEGGGGRFTDVLLRPRVVVTGDLALAKRLHERAHDDCFIARSVNFPVRHEVEVVAKPET